MNKKAVIFDLDGTLLNTLEDLTDSTNYALEKFNYPTKTVVQVRNYVGNGVAKLIERAIPDGLNNSKFSDIENTFKKHYKNNMYNKTKPYDGILEMLEKIKKSGLKIAVVSNKFDEAVKELCKTYFAGLTDFCAGENEAAGIRKKPAPDTVIKVLKEFKLNPEDAVYVGDSEVDIQTAQNSKMDCISVLWGFKDEDFLLEHGASHIIKTPDEIFKYL
ncbi:MAG: HAD family hydrolase [Cyanobacteriota bacterium]|nr:HAD family hydrolase [Cyanobacteriota bacterium]MDY6358386.1 HAD family hydrolase [Cyanobacteriota bacterium]MDY6383717.1 HAD family hydrolase [Cyanobacteriota bacterium]